MKKIKKILFISVIFTLLSINANAATAFTQNIDNPNKCPKDKLYLATVGTPNSTTALFKDGKYRMYFYNFYSKRDNAENKSESSFYAISYCISPAKTSAFNSGEHSCNRPVNPKARGSDFALAYAYQQLIKKGFVKTKYSNQTDTLDARKVGEITFRWILSHFGRLDEAGSDESALNYSKYSNRKKSDYFIQSKPAIKNSIKISEAAVKYGDKINDEEKTYQDYVDDGTLWADQWNVSASISSTSGTITTLSVTISPKGSAASTINWNDFTFSCENGYTCTKKSTTVSSDNSSAVYVIEINTARGDTSVCNYGMKIKTSYKDIRNAQGYLMFYNPSSNTNQKQLALIVPNIIDLTFNSSISLPVNVSFCPIPPPTPTPTPEEHKACSIETDSKGARTYYCEDIVNNVIVSDKGVLCSQNEYRQQCVNICKYHSSTTGITYYCSSNDLDVSGRTCEYRDYLEECYCEPNRAKCQNNPNASGCEGYADQCPNCNASVSMPGTCNDFNVESSITGTISDINKQATSCNYSVNPVKRCILEGKDTAGNEYKIEEMENNQYCHVYCAEEYTFNIPTAQHSTSGGYFNLSLKVSGTRNCYLGNASDPNSPLNINGFIKDIDEANIKLVQMWNEYNMWNELKKRRKNLEDKYNRDHEDLYKSEHNNNNNNNRPGSSNNNNNNRPGSSNNNNNTTEGSNDDEAMLEEFNRTPRDYTWQFNVYRIKRNNYSTGTRSSKLELEVIKQSNTIRTTPNELDKKLERDIKRRYERYKARNDDLMEKVDDYTECTNFNNNMIFDPEITFTYKDYSQLVNQNGSGKFSRSSDVETKIENTYCYGDTNNQYICNGPKLVTNSDSTVIPDIISDKGYASGIPTTIQGNYISCVDSECSVQRYVASRARWVQKSKTMSATFVPKQNFSTYHQYGTVLTGQNCPNGYNNCLWTRLPDTALPVELKTGKGAFPFTIKFSNIGQSNQNESSLGRLIGSNYSVLNAFNNLPNDKKCSYNSGKKVDSLTQSTGYVCAYINNCDNCNVTCSGSSCNLISTCNGDNCPVSCRTCIYDGENTTYKYRTISLNNIFPNSCSKTSYNCRSEGYNWYYKKSGTSTFPVSKKAEATVKEIENLGEKVYEDTYKQYSYTLTPAQLNAIRGYNKAVKSYANTSTNTGANALSCDQVQYNGLNYSVRCKSTFLNDASGTYFTSNIARNNTTKFTLWTETANCPNGNCLSRTDGIGPSWK